MTVCALASMLNLKELPRLVFEACLVVVHIPPFVDHWDISNPDIRYAMKILTVVTFIKLYFIIEVTTTASPINSQKGKFVG